MRLTILATVLAVLSAACAPQPRPAAPPAGGEPLDRSYDIGCQEAFRYGIGAMRTRGYEVSGVTRSASGGTISAENPDAGTQTLTISCGASGVSVSASGGGHWADNGLRMSFGNLAQARDRIWPPPKGTRALAELVRGPETPAYFSRQLSGVSAVRLRFINGSNRAVKLVPSRTKARPKGGSWLGAIEPASARARVGSGANVLDTQTVSAGEEVVGFLFFPAGDYASIRLVMIDVPTGEADEIELSLR